MEKHAGGRPLLFKTPGELQKKIDGYFKYCDREEKPYTIGGLSVYLDVDRHTIQNYGDKDKFFTTVKKARDKIEAYAEEQLYRNGTVSGIIFNLKNNYGWKDTIHNENTNHNYDEVANKLKKIVDDE